MSYKSIHTGQQIDAGVSAALNPDIVPTAGSNALMTSGGTKSAIIHDLANIVATGSTNNTGATIGADTFFYLNGELIQAKTDIASGATFTLNTNYKVVTAGGLNDLKASVIKTVSEQFTTSQFGWVFFPAGREIINASFDIYNTLFTIWYPSGSQCIGHAFFNTNSGAIASLEADTTYTIDYAYFDRHQ